MPQNILKNQMPLVSGLKRNSKADAAAATASTNLNEQNQYHTNSSIIINNNIHNNHNPSKNTTFGGSNTISKLNQGKLIFLNEKFANKSENNYDELITNKTSKKTSSSSKKCHKKQEETESESASSCTCCSLSEEASLVKTRRKPSGESTQAKRLSCEELEDLSERFADFIKIDTSLSASASSAPQMSANPYEVSMPRTQSKAPYLTLNSTRRPSPPSPPLPPPPADLLNDNQCQVDSHGKQSSVDAQGPVQIPSRLSSRLSVLSAESSSGESSLASSSSSNSSTCSVIGKLLL